MMNVLYLYGTSLVLMTTLNSLQYIIFVIHPFTHKFRTSLTHRRPYGVQYLPPGHFSTNHRPSGQWTTCSTSWATAPPSHKKNHVTHQTVEGKKLIYIYRWLSATISKRKVESHSICGSFSGFTDVALTGGDPDSVHVQRRDCGILGDGDVKPILAAEQLSRHWWITLFVCLCRKRTDNYKHKQYK